LVEDYRAFQKRIGTSRNVVVTPSTYGVDNRVTLDAVAAFGPQARAVVVVNDTLSDAELKHMHGQGARGIRFNFAPVGATTPEMIEPLSNGSTKLGWHIQINAPAAKIIEIMPILDRVQSPIVFDHLAHIPEPEGINHPLCAQVRALMDKGKTWVKLSGAYADTKVGPPTYADSTAIAQAYAKAAPEDEAYNPGIARVDAEHVFSVAEFDVVKNGMAPQAAIDKAFKRVDAIFTKYPIAQA